MFPWEAWQVFEIKYVWTICIKKKHDNSYVKYIKSILKKKNAAYQEPVTV